MSKIKLVFDLDESSSQLLSSYQREGLRYEQLQSLQFLLAELASGMQEARLNIQIGSEDGESASGEVTISGSGAQSITINGEALVGGTDYAIADLSANEIALNAAEAIRNSQSSLVQAVFAEANGAVITITAKDAGEVGNLVTLAASGDAAASVSVLEGGVDPEQHIYLFNRSA